MRQLRACLLVGAVAIASRYPCWFSPFVYDDTPAVVSHPVVRLQEPWWRAFSLDYWGSAIGGHHTHGSYRPLTTLSFAASAAAWPGASGLLAGGRFPPAPPFRAVSLALHALVSAQLLRLCAALSGSLPAAAVAAALFAATPLHAEPVCCVALRGDLLAGLCALLCVEAFLRFLRRGAGGWLAAALAAAGVGTFCKETGVAALLAAALLGVLHALAVAGGGGGGGSGGAAAAAGAQRGLLGACSALLAALALFLARLAIQGNRVPVFSAFDNVSINLPPAPRALTLAYLAARHLALLAVPWPLGVDWSGFALPPVVALSDPRNALTAAVAVAVAAVAAAGLRDSGLLRGGVAAAGALRGGKGATAGGARGAPDAAAGGEADPTAPGAEGGGAVSAADVSTEGEAAPPLLFDRPLPPGFATLFALGFTLASLAPSSGLLFTVGFTLAERILYAPAMGAAMLLALAVAGVERRLIKVDPEANLNLKSGAARNARAAALLWAPLAALLAAALYGSAFASSAWTDDATLWARLLAHAPGSAKGWHTLGVVAAGVGDVPRALGLYRESQRVFEAFVGSRVHPALAPWDSVYPDPYVNEAQLLVATAPPGDVVAKRAAGVLYRRVLDGVAVARSPPGVPLPVPRGGAGALLLPHPAAAAARACAPTAPEGSDVALRWDAHTACAAAGTAAAVHPAYLRVHERLVLLAAAAFNAAVLGAEVEGGGNRSGGSSSALPTVEGAEALLTASALLARADPDLVPPSLAHAWADRAARWGLHSLATRWHDRQLRWHLRALRRAADAADAPLPAALAALPFTPWAAGGRGGDEGAGPTAPPAARAAASNASTSFAAARAAAAAAHVEVASLLASYAALVRGVRAQGRGWEAAAAPAAAAVATESRGGGTFAPRTRVSFSEADLASALAVSAGGGSAPPEVVSKGVAAALRAAVRVGAGGPAPAPPPPPPRAPTNPLGPTVCILVPHAPGARSGRRGGPPSLRAAAAAPGLLPAAALPVLHRCATPSDFATPCGRALISAARAAEAAVSVFKEARRAGRFAGGGGGGGGGGGAPCTCSLAAAEAGEPAAPQLLRLCAPAAVALPHFAPPPASPLFGLAPLPFALSGARGNHSCAPTLCARWPADAEAADGGGPVLGDFGPVEPDRLTLPQALFFARRAEALAVGWLQGWAGGEGAADGALPTDVVQAIYAGTGPMLALLNACGCGAEARL
jgi:hypothetical protein